MISITNQLKIVGSCLLLTFSFLPNGVSVGYVKADSDDIKAVYSKYQTVKPTGMSDVTFGTVTVQDLLVSAKAEAVPVKVIKPQTVNNPIVRPVETNYQKDNCVAQLNKLLHSYSGTPWRDLGGVFYDAAVSVGGDCDTARWAIAIGGAEGALGKASPAGKYNSWGWGGLDLGNSWTEGINNYIRQSYSKYLSKKSVDYMCGTYKMPTPSDPTCSEYKEHIYWFLNKMY